MLHVVIYGRGGPAHSSASLRCENVSALEKITFPYFFFRTWAVKLGLPFVLCRVVIVAIVSPFLVGRTMGSTDFSRKRGSKKIGIVAVGGCVTSAGASAAKRLPSATIVAPAVEFVANVRKT